MCTAISLAPVSGWVVPLDSSPDSLVMFPWHLVDSVLKGLNKSLSSWVE